MKRLAILVAAGVLIFAASAQATTTWRHVAHSSSSGPFPYASGDSFVPHPVAFRLKGYATPRAPVTVHYQIDCYRGGSNRTIVRTLRNQTAPLTLNLAPTMTNPDDCGFNASFYYTSVDQGGHVVLDLYAKR